jgi:hypothetical protein
MEQAAVLRLSYRGQPPIVFDRFSGEGNFWDEFTAEPLTESHRARGTERSVDCASDPLSKPSGEDEDDRIRGGETTRFGRGGGKGGVKG